MTAALPRRAAPRRRHRGREQSTAYLFIAPNLLLLGLFVLLPLVQSVGIGFQRTNGFGQGEFVGLANYARLVADPVFWRSLVNTLLFTIITTPLSMLLGFGAAVLLNGALPARAVFRSVLILPMAVSGVATALIGLLIFDENSGVLNELLRTVGLPALSWQSAGAPAFLSIVLVTLWWRAGFNMLIYLAGLQGLSQDLQEAAMLDGAVGLARLRFITLPLLGPQSFFLLVINVIYSFQVFDLVFVMTGGGPEDATSVLVTYAYQNGFEVRDQGYAAAIGVVLLLLALGFTAIRWRTDRSRDVTE